MRLPRISTLLRCAGRLAAALLIAFWGTFFVEHVVEWFLSGGDLPPPKVWFAMGGHLAMLVGLAILLFLPRPGSAVLLAGTALFLVAVWKAGALWVAAVNLVPPALFLLAVLAARPARV